MFDQQSPASSSARTTSTITAINTPAPEPTNTHLEFPLPSEPESLRLLALFLAHIGTAQHFLDPRTFSDAVALLYKDHESRDAQVSTVWFTQYLLVIALAKLADVETPVYDGEPPGGEFFSEAIRRLPSMHRLPRCGVIAVEILCLIGVYLQWSDRKKDAYFYVSSPARDRRRSSDANIYFQIGNAVRLAISQGCHLPASLQDCLPSERAHRTRVWWTAYMLDRCVIKGFLCSQDVTGQKY